MRYLIFIAFALTGCAHVPDQVLVEKCGERIGNPSAKILICKFIKEVED